MLTTAFILLAVVALIAWRPGGLPVALTASLGAAAMFALGYVDLADVGRILGMTWEATATLIALLLLARALDEAGLFAWSAAKLARLCAPSRPVVWLAYAVLAVVLTLLLANDGAIIILTPILAEMAGLLRWNGKEAAPFLWTAGFLIDAASTPLVMANLTNIMAAEALDLSLYEYWRLNAPGFAGAVLASLVVLALAFRSGLKGTYDATSLPEPALLVKDKILFVAGWCVLGALTLMYLLNRLWPLPVVLLVGTAAAGVLAVVAWRRPQRLWPMLRQAPWDVIVFATAMFVVVWGVGMAGWRQTLAAFWLPWQADPVMLALVVGITVSLLSALANNLPALLFALLVIPDLPGEARLLAAAAAIVGSNIGCKLTPYGSLATLLWLDQLDRHGYGLKWGEVLKVGLLLTPPVVAAALATLVLWH